MDYAIVSSKAKNNLGREIRLVIYLFRFDGITFGIYDIP